MNKLLFSKIYIIPLLIIFCVQAYAVDIAGGHTNNITAIIHRGNKVISAGEDGYIVIWDTAKRTASDRFQLSANSIQYAVSHPSMDEICVVESGGLGNNIISVWNYTLKKKLFSLHSFEPVTFVNYSAGGNFIIASGLNGRELTLINSQTGQIIKTFDVPPGTISYAATGRAERNIFIYQGEHENNSLFEQTSFMYSDDSGQILYMDLDSGLVTSYFKAPGFLSNPVIFSNNSFLAGISLDGLLLIDAASGAIFDIKENIDRNALLCPFNNDLYCLTKKNGAGTLYRFSVNGDGKFVTLQELSLPFEAVRFSSFAFNNTFIFALQNNLLLLDPQNKLIRMDYSFNTRIIEIAAGENNIAALTENGDFFFIPLDYRQMSGIKNLQTVKKSDYSRIISLSSPREDSFLLWQTSNTGYAPQLIRADQITLPQTISSLITRFPLRSITSMNGKIAILDSAGNISVREIENITERAVFSFSSIGAVDAAFIDNGHLLISRSAINSNSPFLSANYITGETIHISYPAQTGLTVYTGNSGIFAEAIEQDRYGFITTVIYITPALTKNGVPEKIFEYRGEASYLSIAESGDSLAVCSNDGAVILSKDRIEFERTNGLPVKLIGCNNFFLSLDNESSIVWHDNKNGKILAVFSLYEDQWKLLSDNRQTSGILSRE